MPIQGGDAQIECGFSLKSCPSVAIALMRTAVRVRAFTHACGIRPPHPGRFKPDTSAAMLVLEQALARVWSWIVAYSTPDALTCNDPLTPDALDGVVLDA